MNTSLSASLMENYQWLLSLYVIAGIVAASLIGLLISTVVPTFREARQLNVQTYKQKMERPSYAANHKWNRKYLPSQLLTFVVILPFCLTLDAQPWWRVALDIVIILMAYDFVYYFTHRFLFHDSALFAEGPLKWMHAVHHRQHNPCKMDSSFIHPLEVAIGSGLFIATILILSLLMGRFHVATVTIAWVAFSQINTHNHALWTSDRFPFRYLNYASKMHHNHHGKFTGGNYATITLLYDWMFGTLDDGTGRKGAKAAARGDAQ
jgi:sterol desaturase/sphingolipid hydroxylase (fatty acid hydroxylase superfamily)